VSSLLGLLYEWITADSAGDLIAVGSRKLDVSTGASQLVPDKDFGKE